MRKYWFIVSPFFKWIMHRQSIAQKMIQLVRECTLKGIGTFPNSFVAGTRSK